EANESFTVTLSNAASAAQTEILTATASGTVNNDDTSTVNVSSASGAEAGGPITFTVSLSNPFDVSITVPLTLTDVTTVAADRSGLSAASVTFAAGATSASVTVTPVDDNVVEADE